MNFIRYNFSKFLAVFALVGLIIALLIDTLSSNFQYVSNTGGGSYNSSNHTVF